MQKAGISHPFRGWAMTGHNKALGRKEQWQHWSSQLGTGRERGLCRWERCCSQCAGNQGTCWATAEPHMSQNPQTYQTSPGDVFLLPSVTQLNSKEPMIPSERLRRAKLTALYVTCHISLNLYQTPIMALTQIPGISHMGTYVPKFYCHQPKRSSQHTRV